MRRELLMQHERVGDDHKAGEADKREMAPVQPARARHDQTEAQHDAPERDGRRIGRGKRRGARNRREKEP